MLSGLSIAALSFAFCASFMGNIFAACAIAPFCDLILLTSPLTVPPLRKWLTAKARAAMPAMPTATPPRIFAVGLSGGTRRATIAARSPPVPLGEIEGYAVTMKSGVDVADTFTGLDVGHAVIIKRGVLVALSEAVLVVEGKDVIKYIGVDVKLAVLERLDVAVSVIVVLGVAVSVCVVLGVAVSVCVVLGVAVSVCVVLGVAVNVSVVLGVQVPVEVCVSVADAVMLAVFGGVPVAVRVRVDVGVGGGAEELGEAASFPTVISIPHTCGRDSVAE